MFSLKKKSANDQPPTVSWGCSTWHPFFVINAVDLFIALQRAAGKAREGEERAGGERSRTEETGGREVSSGGWEMERKESENESLEEK